MMVLGARGAARARGRLRKRAPDPATRLDLDADAGIASGVLLIEAPKLGRGQVP
ncbi:hypothetical protein ACU4GR_02490 [Methylobacterium oryzae CBMB20]